MVKVVSPADMGDRSPFLDRDGRATRGPGSARGADGHEQVPAAGPGAVVVLVVADEGEHGGLGRGGQRDAGPAGAGGGDGVEQAPGVECDGDRATVQLAADG